MAKRVGSSVITYKDYKELKDEVGCLKILVQTLQDQIDATSNLTSFISSVQNVTADVTLNVDSGLTTIIDISVYDNATGEDLTDSFALTRNGGIVNIDSSESVSGLIVTVIGIT